MMRGADEASGPLFGQLDLAVRIPPRHPLRKTRRVVSDALARLDAAFAALCTDFGRPPIPPERLIRVSLLQSRPGPHPAGGRATGAARQVMAQMDDNRMLCWFVGLGIDDPVWAEGHPEICPGGSISAIARESPDEGTALRPGAIPATCS